MIRLWNREEDYPMLQGWWEGHGWPAVPAHVLPPLGVIWDDCAAAFAYMDNGGTGVAFIEWIVTNPSKGMKAIQGLHHVIDFLTQEVASLNYGVLITTCRQESLSRFLQRKGFEVSDHSMIHHIKSIQGGNE